jgi:hypothetical protein
VAPRGQIEPVAGDLGSAVKVGPTVRLDLQLDRLALLRSILLAFDFSQNTGDRGDPPFDLVQDTLARAARVPGRQLELDLADRVRRAFLAAFVGQPAAA